MKTAQPGTVSHGTLLTSAQRLAYDEALASAWKAYSEATAPAEKAYDEALASAQKAHTEARAVAFARARQAFAAEPFAS